MEKYQIIEYILEYELVEIKEIIEKFSIQPERLLSQITDYNEISFKYEIEHKEGLITVKEKVNNVIIDHTATRLVELERLWLTGLFHISELEIIFGRSRKTLYKNIQQIKQKFSTERTGDAIVQSQLNKYSYDKLQKIASYKQISVEQVIRSICEFVAKEQHLDVNLERLVELNLNYQFSDEYLAPSTIFASEIIHSIETYLKVKFINEYKINQVHHHVESSYYKYVNNIYIQRIDIENVFPRDKERFEKVATILEMLFKSMHLYYCDEELLYLSLYFLDQNDFSYLKVKVIAEEGSSKLLVERQIEENFDNFKFVTTNPDYVISTYDHFADTIVKTKFDVNDIKQISKHLKLKSNRSEETKLYFKLKSVLKKNVSLSEFSEILNTEKRQTKRSLLECMMDNGFYSFGKVESLGSTIKLISTILMERGSVSTEYLNSLVEQMNLYSTEFNLINNVALVHAPVADNIYKSDLIVMYSREGFQFTNSYVHLIIAFSAVDDVDLLLPLQDLYMLLDSPAFIEQLDLHPAATDFKRYLEKSLKKR